MKTFLFASAAALVTLPAFAETHIMVQDAYARASGLSAKAGAAFMQIMNHGDEADQLIDVRSDIAKRVELHTHKIDDQGVAKMMHVPEGFAIPASGMHELKRGGDHVMFMGLKGKILDGDVVTVTLVFEKAGELVVEIPVDLKRGQMGSEMKMNQGAMDHSNMDHGNMNQGEGAASGASN
ncbi:copper chaperone PCu(A)C [Aliiroseovarius sp. KMU-50]|uniref:Copper chaperone PCu(A)C n=2 Tax=Aliiroseovarius salicola TaxID=3009082 RepID=A0ABT4VW67_9RHOB|nr:copper chaperone PCu(A)C [Aliiroseovarius sp. KMU-50]MDA5092497.1 copper chaperone PCu(A)C [Aliiroseovarius sp. KMU-50]